MWSMQVPANSFTGSRSKPYSTPDSASSGGTPNAPETGLDINSLVTAVCELFEAGPAPSTRGVYRSRVGRYL